MKQPCPQDWKLFPLPSSTENDVSLLEDQIGNSIYFHIAADLYMDLGLAQKLAHLTTFQIHLYFLTRPTTEPNLGMAHEVKILT